MFHRARYMCVCVCVCFCVCVLENWEEKVDFWVHLGLSTSSKALALLKVLRFFKFRVMGAQRKEDSVWTDRLVHRHFGGQVLKPKKCHPSAKMFSDSWNISSITLSTRSSTCVSSRQDLDSLLTFSWWINMIYFMATTVQAFWLANGLACKKKLKKPCLISKHIWRELMTEKVIFILKYWWKKKTFVSRKRGSFGQKGRSLSTTRGLPVHGPGPTQY